MHRLLEEVPVLVLAGGFVGHQGGYQGLAVDPPELHVPFQLNRTLT